VGNVAGTAQAVIAWGFFVVWGFFWAAMKNKPKVMEIAAKKA
jgi:Ni,Fe-hydrogenase I small subunit